MSFSSQILGNLLSHRYISVFYFVQIAAFSQVLDKILLLRITVDILITNIYGPLLVTSEFLLTATTGIYGSLLDYRYIWFSPGNQ